MLRRKLLLGTTGASLGLFPVGRGTWAVAGEQPASAQRRLIVVFLRGAADGLSIVVPYADPGYYQARSSIALAPPGTDGGTIDLDRRFGLHPALGSLMPLWTSGKLGFVHASGSPDPTRSHFDAQDYMESATPGRKNTQDGWLNRLIGALPLPAGGPTTPNRALSIGAVLPRIYAGNNQVANIASGTAATRPTQLDRSVVSQAFDKLYSADDSMSRAYKAAQQSRREVMGSMGPNELEREMTAANNGAPLPHGFPNDAVRLATLMRNDSRIQLAFMEVGGWDTHANQGGVNGQLANKLGPLGRGLAALATRLGPVFDETVVLVMSEFGRTVRQNGNNGTDHGHGNVMWMLGGQVNGGKVLGRWPGLESNALFEGRDLAVTTDFRVVLAEVLERHLLLSDSRLDEVLPQFELNRKSSLRLIRA